ncbi:hypothetical protein Tco_0460772, partial [Tanacetum coccineum]
MYLPTTSESSARDSYYVSSAELSHKRCRSLADTVHLAIPALGALFLTSVDLMPPHKRFKDSYSLKDSIEEDIDANALADIKTDASVDVGIGMKVGVGIV